MTTETTRTTPGKKINFYFIFEKGRKKLLLQPGTPSLQHIANRRLLGLQLKKIVLLSVDNDTEIQV